MLTEWLFRFVGALAVLLFALAALLIVTSPITVSIILIKKARANRRAEEERERARQRLERERLIEQRRREALTPEQREQEDRDRRAEIERRRRDQQAETERRRTVAAQQAQSAAWPATDRPRVVRTCSCPKKPDPWTFSRMGRYGRNGWHMWGCDLC